GELEDFRNFLGRARAQNERRVAAIEIALLDEIRLLIRRIGDRVLLADDGDELRHQLLGERRAGMVRHMRNGGRGRMSGHRGILAVSLIFGSAYSTSK